MPDEVDRYPTDPLDGPAQFKDMLKGLERRLAGVEGAASAGGVPVGVMFATRNAALDDGYLWCNGDPIPAEHTALIAICGANTPDYRGRVFVGLDNMGGAADAGRISSANTLGGTGGISSSDDLLGVATGRLLDAANATAGPGQVGFKSVQMIPPHLLCNVIIKF